MKDEFDYIVVGAGSAGCVVANRLSARRDLHVLVLEAGGRDWSPYLQVPAGRIRMSDKYDWDYPAEPDPSRKNNVESWESGKVLGGSSSINGMFWVRGSRQDFDGWAKDGCDGWEFDSLLPFFKQSETFEGGPNNYRGGHGPQHVSFLHLHHPLTDVFVQAAQAAGHPFNDDYNGERQEGVAYGQVSQRHGLRHSTARAYLAPAMRRRNVTVRTHAFVRRVIFDNATVVGVEYERNGSLFIAKCRHEVILSGGAFASPKLLLLSGIGPSDALRSVGIEPVLDLPGVGQNLQNHLGVSLIHEVTIPTLNREFTPWNVIKHGLNLLFRGRGAATSAVGHAVIFGSISGDGVEYETTFSPFGRFAQKENGRGRHKLQLTSTNAVTTRVGLTHPRSRGAISLRSADPNDPPKIIHELASDPKDIEDLMLACQMLRAVLQTEPMDSYLVREIQPGDDIQSAAQWEDVIRHKSGSKHAAGSCKMGVDEMAVVDTHLRVRGVHGLRVIDLSVTPLITSGNTNAAAIVIGERGFEFILSELDISQRVVPTSSR